MALALTMAAALVSVVVSTALTTAPASAAPDKPKAIVAIGDSYISGEAGRWAGNANTGAGGTAWGTDLAAISCLPDREDRCDHEPSLVYLDGSDVDKGNGCHKSRMAEIKGAEIDGVGERERFNLACSGATTDSILRTIFKGQAPQITQLESTAASYNVTTVVVSISGNDLRFGDIIGKCAEAYLRGGALCSVSEARNLENRLPEVRSKVVETLREIHRVMQASGQDRGSYRLILQSYPTPIPTGDKYRWRERGAFWERYRRGGCPFLDADTDWANKSLVPGIRDMLRDAAFSTDASFLDLSEAFAGHELCTNEADQAGSQHSRANPLRAEDAEWVRWLPYLRSRTFPWESQGHQQEAIHPNAFGQEALSACLTKMVAASPTPGQAFRCKGAARAKPADVQVQREIVHQESWGRILNGRGGRPAVFTYGGQQHAFASDGNCLEHMWWSAASGPRRDQWGCGINSVPAAYVGAGQQHVFAAGGGCLEHFWWEGGTEIKRNRWGCGIDSAPAGFLYGEQQHAFAKSGNCLEHFWWEPGRASNDIQRNRWGCGIDGYPAVFVDGEQQHAFAKNGNCLEHFWWEPGRASNDIQHDQWGCGIDSPPAVFVQGRQQHAFAKNGECLEHFWWEPGNSVQHDQWGCGIDTPPAAFASGEQQHAFATKDNCVEHFWWERDRPIRRDRWGCGVDGNVNGFASGDQQHVFAHGQRQPTQHFWYAG
ncbi:GDSL-type esterase/lipase family protein [Actinomadura rubrisoli]|nr:GDSL-type esterase/lipase family protein [Actinomadura rubrisoli]